MRAYFFASYEQRGQNASMLDGMLAYQTAWLSFWTCGDSRKSEKKRSGFELGAARNEKAAGV